MAYSPVSNAEIRAGVASVSSAVISKLANNIEEIANGGSGAPRLRIAALPAPTAGNAIIREFRSNNGNEYKSANLTSTYTAIVTWPVVVTGTYRLRLSMSNAASSGTLYGRIYRTDTAYGTERSVAANSSGTWTQDLSFDAGDQIRLYVRHTGQGTFHYFEFLAAVANPMRPIAKSL